MHLCTKFRRGENWVVSILWKDKISSKLFVVCLYFSRGAQRCIAEYIGGYYL